MTSFLSRTSRYWILLILLLGLALRLGYVLTEPFELPEHDQKNYTEMAVRLLDHGVYGYLEEEPNTLVTPGFPLFLALVFKLFGYGDIAQAHMNVRILQAFLSLVILWYLYRTGERLFNRPAGLLAALFAAVYGPFVMAASLILTEILFLALLSALLYYQVRIMQENRTRDHIIAGLLLGLLVLTRPNAIILAATPYVFLWFRHRKPFFREIAIGVGCFALAMLPWWVRNWLTFHELILVSRGGAGNPFLFGTIPYNQGSIDWTKVQNGDQFGAGVERIKEGLREDPWLWIRWYTIGKMSTMYLDNIYMWPYTESVPVWYKALLGKLHYFLVYTGMFFAAVASLWNTGVRFLAVQLVLFLGLHLLFVPETRYTLGTFPMLMLITAYILIKAIRYAGGSFKRRTAGRA
ncbi:hypothetical protein J31TS4_04190 [Paenibacillus sp. J31TS4]|uniref:glycosyltransferase family 39 protein n=1 Tax=Paenibacillus sp. J31TS4 TaxID=2807195 RepID=UPI001B0227F1|nr:glycosyltransferase family 39 protein [Paenibacillus sp. J31TS4]GIP37139.1 hypothetical protein J31TS4_04190 [Paenibacillus sp. J31TS4]